MVFNVNKQWVLRNLYRETILNKYNKYDRGKGQLTFDWNAFLFFFLRNILFCVYQINEK